MPRGVHITKRKSGAQQRKSKKAKMNVLQSMSGSIFKYVKIINDSQSSSKANDSHVDQENDSENTRSSSESNSEETESVLKIQEAESNENTQNDSNGTDYESSIEANSYTDELQNMRDISHWSIPVPDKVRIEIIKKDLNISKTGRDHSLLYPGQG